VLWGMGGLLVIIVFIMPIKKAINKTMPQKQVYLLNIIIVAYLDMDSK
jgi:hypothetical protein